MPTPKQPANFLDRLRSFVTTEVRDTREGVRSATDIKKMLPIIIAVAVILIVVTLGRK